MEKDIRDFLNVIRNGRCENTYKLAWGRAIAEICFEKPDIKSIPLTDIAIKVFKYYWNQTIFFGMKKGFLEQSQNPNKEPEIIQYVKWCILEYQSKSCNFKPIFYEKVSTEIGLDTDKVVSILKKDVSHRFQNLNGSDDIAIYHYRKNDDVIDNINAKVISAYYDILVDSINLRWTLELERFNPATPNICKKVKLLDNNRIRRSQLSKFDKYLNLENPYHICFRCNSIISESQISRDHVLPWSFLYSDDLWNIVFTHKSCNSEKSDSVPSRLYIDKLMIRNDKLIDKIDDKKWRFELLHAKENNIIEALWIACGGH